MSGTNWETGDLRLVNLETGEARDVTGRGYDAGGFAWTSAFSTDGRRVSVAWYVYEADSQELRIMNLDGTASRVLLPASTEPESVEPLDWSPSDDQILVALQGADRVWKLGLVSVDHGSVRILKTLSWLAPGGEQSYPRACFSPDGKYVAYDYRPDLEERTRDIYALHIDGSRETTLVSGPAVDRLLGWIPDGSGILFYSERNGTPGIWRLPLRDGMPAGEPELVRSEVPGVIPLGFIDGGFAYAVGVDAPQVHIAVVDPDIGRVLEPPRPVDDPPYRASLSVDWSPDGSRLAYFAHDRSAETLVIRSAGGDKVREIPLSPILHTSNGTLKWLQEDAFFVFAVEKGHAGIYRMDPRDGSFSRLSPPEWDAWGPKWFEVAPDGRTLYLFRPPSDDATGRDVVAFDQRSGGHRVLGTAHVEPPTLAIAPDGGEIAYVARDPVDGALTLWVISALHTGQPRALYRATGDLRMRRFVAWTPDGSRLLFVQVSRDRGRTLWSVAARGDEDPVLFEGGEWRGGGQIRMHPDGRRLAVVGGRSRGAIWKLEGY